MTGTYHQTK